MRIKLRIFKDYNMHMVKGDNYNYHAWFIEWANGWSGIGICWGL